MINPNDPVPLHVQIRQSVERKIKNGTFFRERYQVSTQFKQSLLIKIILSLQNNKSPAA
ncbi:hypothetical protein [Sporosarcina cascadiensis]|uniref:hypothetical protein n=1 Tax=Sporosarcina cascadiensis TaxID=2660747 RepID=UPI00129B1B54|nr:hypothetical protein [Sporosarcina cascadiensis]